MSRVMTHVLTALVAVWAVAGCQPEETGAGTISLNGEQTSTKNGLWQREDVLNGASDELQVWGGTGSDGPDFTKPGFHCELLVDEQGRNVGPILRDNTLPATFMIAPAMATQAHRPASWHSGDANENVCGVWSGNQQVCTFTAGQIYLEKLEDETLTGHVVGNGFQGNDRAPCSGRVDLSLVPDTSSFPFPLR